MLDRKLVPVLVIVLLCAVILGDAVADQPKRIRIGITTPTIEALHFAYQKAGYEKYAAKMGVEVLYTSAGGYANVEKQVNQIQDFIAKKVDVIIISATHSTGTKNVVEEAVKAGIPVINVNIMTESNMVASQIRSDDKEMGIRQAKMMEKALGGKGNVVMLNGPAGTTLAIRGESFGEYIKKNCPNIKILAEQFVVPDPAKAMAVMEDYLQTYKNIDGVFNWCDNVGVVVAQVVKAAGKSGKIKITMIDFVNPDVPKGIKEGLIYGTVAQQPIVQAKMAIDTAIKLTKKENVEKQQWAPIIDITKENIDKVDLSGIVPPK